MEGSFLPWNGYLRIQYSSALSGDLTRRAVPSVLRLTAKSPTTEKNVYSVATLYTLARRSELSITLYAHIKMLVVFSVHATE